MQQRGAIGRHSSDRLDGGLGTRGRSSCLKGSSRWNVSNTAYCSQLPAASGTLYLYNFASEVPLYLYACGPSRQRQICAPNNSTDTREYVYRNIKAPWLLVALTLALSLMYQMIKWAAALVYSASSSQGGFSSPSFLTGVAGDH